MHLAQEHVAHYFSLVEIWRDSAGSPHLADSVEKLCFANDPEIREEFRLILRASWEAC